MASASSNTAPEVRQSAFRVETPRASDAIGRALRDVYAREPALPEDMAALLRRLNDTGRRNPGHPGRG